MSFIQVCDLTHKNLRLLGEGRGIVKISCNGRSAEFDLCSDHTRELLLWCAERVNIHNTHNTTPVGNLHKMIGQQ